MNDFWTWLLLTVSVIGFIAALCANSCPRPGRHAGCCITRFPQVFGIGSGEKTAKGNVFVEPLARVTPSGEWQALPCLADTGGNQQNACSQFEREYLSKPHTYTAVSADGRGATIQAEPTTLSECFGYTGTGKYSGANIETSAIAASSTDFFSDGPAPQLLPDVTAKPFLKAFADAVPGGLDSNLFLKVFSLRLETQDLVLVQRSYIHRAEPLKFIFAIGAMDHGQFHLLQWKENTGDEDEVVLGTVRLTNGRDFLVTTVADPEGQWFRVYGIRDGKLVVVYSGGGSSC